MLKEEKVADHVWVINTKTFDITGMHMPPNVSPAKLLHDITAFGEEGQRALGSWNSTILKLHIKSLHRLIRHV